MAAGHSGKTICGGRRAMPRMNSECATRPGNLDTLPPIEILFGRTAAMQHVRSQITIALEGYLPILIRGESGTGKGLIAKFIHFVAPWRDGPFSKVYCPAISPTPLEIGLFGTEPDFFSMDHQNKRHPMRARSEGTIFLDEIAELDLRLQAKLLGRMRSSVTLLLPMGEDGREAHIICSTSRSIEKEIEKDRFLVPLLRRINGMALALPPLRERRGDIPSLIEHFLRFYQRRFNCPMIPTSDKWIRQLQRYDWPGNIRELENTVCSSLLLGSEAVLPANPEERGAPGLSGAPLTRHFSKTTKTQAAPGAERGVLLRVLKAYHGNRKQAARSLHMRYRALLHKMKEMGIAPKRIQPTQRNPAFTKATP
jgi:two-component system, NtrC family, response regulator AtoC